MKRRKRRIEKTIILNIISLSVELPASYLQEKGGIYQRKDPPPLELLEMLDAEIRLTFERLNYALEDVTAVLDDFSLLLRDGPPLESLSSESLFASSTTPNQ
ncbi:hypothetical protein AYI68_g1909 [Smittium mucronatum]|uniref:Uncharacterized protein n=1 Tax=Smittium mucronatum TaxID=133383 RepID=A0A1R0H4E6_9FUNG|nr:hypothetical protein AYI68_g1909 [Smittium mucronatum]